MPSKNMHKWFIASLLLLASLPVEAGAESSRMDLINQALDQYEKREPSSVSTRKTDDYLQDSYFENGYFYTTDGHNPFDAGRAPSFDNTDRSYGQDWFPGNTITPVPGGRFDDSGWEQYEPYGETEETSNRGESRASNPWEGSDIHPLLKYFNYGLVLESDRKPYYYVDGILPLIETHPAHADMGLLFTQNRIASQGGVGTYSTGLGYRRLMNDESTIIGLNTFLDYRQKRKHCRVSFGLEYLEEDYEMRVNIYRGLSHRRMIKDTAEYTTYEQAANGYDVEFGGQVPHIDWLRLYGGYSAYDFNHTPDLRGWAARAEISPTRFLKMNFKASEEQYSLEGRLGLSFSTFDMKDWFKNSSRERYHKQERPKADMRQRLLQRVERSFDVVVERWDHDKTVVGNLTNIRLVARFPGTTPATTDDNSNGRVDAGETFEIDFLLINNTSLPSTGISYSNATVSTGWSFNFNTDAPLGDADAGETVRTDDVDDLDLTIPADTAAGTRFNIRMDVTADGETNSLRFGPFVVGDIANEQQYSYF